MTRPFSPSLAISKADYGCVRTEAGGLGDWGQTTGALLEHGGGLDFVPLLAGERMGSMQVIGGSYVLFFAPFFLKFLGFLP